MPGPRVRCPFIGCIRTFARQGDLTQHIGTGIHENGTLRSMSQHRSATLELSPTPSDSETSSQNSDLSPHPYGFFDDFSPFISPEEITTPLGETFHFHPVLRGDRCDKNGNPIPDGSPPEPVEVTENPWDPFESEASYRLGDHLFRKVEMSQNDVDELLDIWYLDVQTQFGGDCAPLSNHRHLLETIDAIKDGNAPWQCYETALEDNLADDAPEWKKTSYQVWYRNPDVVISNILANPDFSREFDAAPYVHINKDGKRRVSDFMSGNFAYRHANMILDEWGNSVDGAMYCPIIIGADKTTVSVATGHVEYHPLYLSIGNLRNGARRGHRNGVIPVGFLPIPKADRKYDKDSSYRVFKKQLYHACIAAIFMSIERAMREPVVRICPDGYHRRIIYDLAAFIADYPEQVYLAGIVQGWCCKCTARNNNLDGDGEPRTREWFETVMVELQGESDILWDSFGIDDDIVPFTHYFPRADIHEMLTADILHQVVKGCFKDMLVDWVWTFIDLEYGEEADAIKDDIDKRISIVPEFPGLRRFPHGRRFKQWTGDDSKALMKVFLPAVEAYIPETMSHCLSAFLDFCYLVRRNDFDETTIQQVQDSIRDFHRYREVFIELGIRKDFSIPRMHSMVHYPSLILDFGAPNGVCSSITESRHISAVKRPWRRSNRYNALSQILLTNQRLDKLAAKRAVLESHGLVSHLHKPAPSPFETGIEDIGAVDDDVQAEVVTAKNRILGYPRFLDSLAEALNLPDLPWLTQRFLYEQIHKRSSDDVVIDDLPSIRSKVNIYHSAITRFRSPSDESGIRGMCQERIRASPSYRGHARHDTVAVVIDHNKPGFRGLSAARARLFFSFKHEGETYSCALVHWFNKYGQSPDSTTRMWIVRPAFTDNRRTEPHLAVISLDTILRSIHLIPVYGNGKVPRTLRYYHTLDAFNSFYVNKYADYHSNEVLY